MACPWLGRARTPHAPSPFTAAHVHPGHRRTLFGQDAGAEGVSGADVRGLERARLLLLRADDRSNHSVRCRRLHVRLARCTARRARRSAVCGRVLADERDSLRAIAIFYHAVSDNGGQKRPTCGCMPMSRRKMGLATALHGSVFVCRKSNLICRTMICVGKTCNWMAFVANLRPRAATFALATLFPEELSWNAVPSIYDAQFLVVRNIGYFDLLVKILRLLLSKY